MIEYSCPECGHNELDIKSAQMHAARNAAAAWALRRK